MTTAIAPNKTPADLTITPRDRRFGRPVRTLMTLGPIWHLGYTVLTRYEGGVTPRLSMKTHLTLDSASALTFAAAGLLMRRQPAAHRLLLAGIGLAELALVARSRSRPGRG